MKLPRFAKVRLPNLPGVSFRVDSYKVSLRVSPAKACMAAFQSWKTYIIHSGPTTLEMMLTVGGSGMLFIVSGYEQYGPRRPISLIVPEDVDADATKEDGVKMSIVEYHLRTPCIYPARVHSPPLTIENYSYRHGEMTYQKHEADSRKR